MADAPPMSSSRPYLIRAMYDWVVDNGLTPYIVVDIAVSGVEVPLEFAEDGKIVLNVAPSAVQLMDMGNDWVSFQARFSGTPRRIHFPAAAVLAVYARENGQGMMFGEAESPSEAESDAGPEQQTLTSVPSTEQGPTEAPIDKPRSRSHLKVVK